MMRNVGLVLALAVFVAPAMGLAGTSLAAPGEDAEPLPTIGLKGPGLAVADLDRAIRFYREGLGMAEVTRLDGPDVIEAILSFGQAPTPPFIFLLRYKGEKGRGPADSDTRLGKLVLNVSDAEALSRRLRAAGYPAGDVSEHVESAIKVFWVVDPDGNRLEITQRGMTRQGNTGHDKGSASP